MKKILHITFHNGPTNDLNYISKQLNFFIETHFFNDGTCGKYNIGHERAKKYWNKHKDYFNKFDIVITSDTAPLSRIFLQNNWNKKLIIWINNRIDYFDGASLDCDFPDKEYYNLIKNIGKNVKIFGYTKFENFYCNNIRDLNIGDYVIKPIGINLSESSNITNIEDIDNMFFIGDYHNDNIMINLKDQIEKLGIKVYNGRYHGANDLKRFKGVIHIPYSWSTYALFEAIQNNIIYFIPSLNFLISLKKNKNFFWSPPFKNEYLEISEWYCEELSEVFVYFDSWDDLVFKINNLNYYEKKNYLQKYGIKHKNDTLKKWKLILEI